ncbi:hypothetical protein [Parashewanella tropica]|uniref:hypothetical protein n=1 Tax=Parashewanella tropica TaxID=2547970 RepID=UPI001FEB247A|nr:hypothetical protein [Parashewanella tropica]
MNYRKAKLEDLGSLKALEQAVVEAERPYNNSIKPSDAKYYDIEYLINDHDSHLLVVEEAGQIIATGYGQLRDSKQSLIHSKHCYLGFMYYLNIEGRALIN